MANLKKYINTLSNKLESRTYTNRRPWGVAISSIRDVCLRRPWYHFRWVSKSYVTAHKKRIFERGHLEEHRIIADLESIGCKVAYGGTNQIRVQGSAGHERGKLDGLVYGTPEYPDRWIMLEAKTTKSTYFNKFYREGIAANSKYEGQFHRYLGLLLQNNNITTKETDKTKPDYGIEKPLDVKKEFGIIDKGVFIVTNKNDESRFIKFGSYDKSIDEDVQQSVKMVLFSEQPPNRIKASLWDSQCHNCDYHSVCHSDMIPDRNCRTCKHVEWHNEGVIHCGFHDGDLSIDMQKAACPDYELGIEDN